MNTGTFKKRSLQVSISIMAENVNAKFMKM